jgi:hypothetical protein
MTKVGINGADVRDVILDQITEAENVIGLNAKNDSTLLAFAKETMQLNKQAIESPTEGYTFPPTHGVVPLLENLTEDQLIYNFRILCNIMYAELYIMRALNQFSTGSYLKAAYNIRKSYKGMNIHKLTT